MGKRWLVAGIATQSVLLVASVALSLAVFAPAGTEAWDGVAGRWSSIVYILGGVGFAAAPSAVALAVLAVAAVRRPRSLRHFATASVAGAAAEAAGFLVLVIAGWGLRGSLPFFFLLPPAGLAVFLAWAAVSALLGRR